jgi:ATP-binding cassette subfamily B protein
MGMRSGGGGGGWRSYLRAEDEKPQVTRSLMLRVFKYSQPYRWQLAGMLVCICISTGLGLLTPLVMRDLIDRTLPAGDVQRLIRLAIALLAIPIVSSAVSVVQRQLNARVGEGVIYDLRSALYGHLQRMSLRFFTHTRVGELMSRLNNDVVGAQNAVNSTLVSMFSHTVQTIALLAVMISLEWRLTLVSLAILPLFFLAARYMGSKLRLIARRQMQVNAEMNAMVNETLNIGGALLVKLFGRTDQEVERFQQRAGSVRDMGISRSMLGSILFAIIGLVMAVGVALVYGLGGYFVILGTFSIGTIVAFGSYINHLYSSLQGLANAPVEFSTSVVSFERVFEVIDLPLDIDDRAGAVELGEVQGQLVFDDVCFQYNDDDDNLLKYVQRLGQIDQVEGVLSGAQTDHKADEAEENAASQARDTALEDISFAIQPGQLAALVGPSGAGKTTLTYLVPRLYDPTQGRILLDGHDLRDVTVDSLSRQIGMVTQENYLFHDTIRTNLTYAKLDATQAKLEEACRAANIHDFIADLPDGYDTIVGERGYRLSGGEKQRIALARVILKDPRILVLDEATSHLDSESEAVIQEALKRVMAGRTSLVIAHRLSTILAADLILVLDRGRIVERGTHAGLLAQNGLYAHLYYTQFEGKRTAAEA